MQEVPLAPALPPSLPGQATLSHLSDFLVFFHHHPEILLGTQGPSYKKKKQKKQKKKPEDFQSLYRVFPWAQAMDHRGQPSLYVSWEVRRSAGSQVRSGPSQYSSVLRLQEKASVWCWSVQHHPALSCLPHKEKQATQSGGPRKTAWSCSIYCYDHALTTPHNMGSLCSNVSFK